MEKEKGGQGVWGKGGCIVNREVGKGLTKKVTLSRGQEEERV